MNYEDTERLGRDLGVNRACESTESSGLVVINYIEVFWAGSKAKSNDPPARQNR